MWQYLLMTRLGMQHFLRHAICVEWDQWLIVHFRILGGGFEPPVNFVLWKFDNILLTKSVAFCPPRDINLEPL